VPNFGAKDLNRSVGWSDKAERHPDRGRLAGSVGAEEAEQLAAIDLQVEVVDCQTLPVSLGEADGPECGLGAGHP